MAMKDTGAYRQVMSTDEYFGDTINRKYYQTIHVALGAIPEAEEWTPGQNYIIQAAVKLKAINRSMEGDKVELEVLMIKPMPDEFAPAMTPEQKKFKKLLG